MTSLSYPETSRIESFESIDVHLALTRQALLSNTEPCVKNYCQARRLAHSCSASAGRAIDSECCVCKCGEKTILQVKNSRIMAEGNLTDRSGCITMATDFSRSLLRFAFRGFSDSRRLPISNLLRSCAFSRLRLVATFAGTPTPAETPKRQPAAPKPASMPACAGSTGASKKASRCGCKITQTGEASWYGAQHHGKQTASGTIFDQSELTAAHPSLPFGSKIKVTNLANGKSVEVEITDRGPFAGNRIIDLSQAAAKVLEMIDSGTANVRLELP